MSVRASANAGPVPTRRCIVRPAVTEREVGAEVGRAVPSRSSGVSLQDLMLIGRIGSRPRRRLPRHAASDGVLSASGRDRLERLANAVGPP